MFCLWGLLYNSGRRRTIGKVKIMAIDWRFVETLEKKYVLKGYVPKNKKGEVIGKSGVTVSTGVDVGQLSPAELVNLFGGLPRTRSQKLIESLMPYTGLKGKEAVLALIHFPLELKQEDAVLLAERVKEKHKNELIEDWNGKSFVNFWNLPDEMQTVLFSLCYNFGARLSHSLPNTFKVMKIAAEKKEYNLAVDWLKSFPSKNPELVKRRQKEAEYLEKLLKPL